MSNSADDSESLHETLLLLGNPEAMAEIAETRQANVAGDVTELNELALRPQG